MRFLITVGLAFCLLLVFLGVVPAAENAMGSAADADTLAAALGKFVTQYKNVLGSARLSDEEKQALKIAIEQGTRLLELTPSDEQKYWTAEFLIKGHLTEAMGQPPSTLAKLEEMEKLVEILEQKPEKVEILNAAKYQILKFTLMLFSKPGPEQPNPYRVKEAVKEYVAENPKSLDFFAKMLTDGAKQYAPKDRQFTIETLKEVAELYRKSAYLDDKDYLEKLLVTAKRFEMVGSPMEFSGVDPDGNKITSTDFKDKVVLIDFWATWCTPCVSALPEMTRLHKMYNKQGFEIVGVSVDKSTKELTKFLEAKKLPWKIISDTATAEKGGTRLATHFGVSDYPTLMLVGRNGKVIATDFDLKALELELKNQFANAKGNGKKLPLEVKAQPITPSLL